MLLLREGGKEKGTTKMSCISLWRFSILCDIWKDWDFKFSFSLRVPSSLSDEYEDVCCFSSSSFSSLLHFTFHLRKGETSDDKGEAIDIQRYAVWIPKSLLLPVRREKLSKSLFHYELFKEALAAL